MSLRFMPARLYACQFALVVALLLAPLLVASPALAHAIITDSVPQNMAVVRGNLLPITLHFNSAIDARRSRLTLVRPNGSIKILTPALTAEPNLLQATATGLMPGKQHLRWQVLSKDGHITHGDIPFEVVR